VHVKVRLALGHVLKPEALIEPNGAKILEPGGQRHRLTLRMSLRLKVLKQARADPAALMRGLDLNLAYL
jgi:hypothetical protein